MDHALLPGNPPVQIALRRSARARRFSLRVSRLDGRVTLTVPTRARTGEALAFAQAQEGWIRKALNELPDSRSVVAGGTVLFEGQEIAIVPAAVRAPVLRDGALVVPQTGPLGPRVAAFMNLAARQRLRVSCDMHAARLGRSYSTIALRDTRSRWGSCSSDGRLMFSWRLVMAPPHVLNYVAAHEVAHLAEMNHSPAFWTLVGQLCPGWEAERHWLRQNGHRLHGYIFD